MPSPAITFRPATEADLSDCNRIHREAIDAYTGRMGMHPSPPEENPGLRRLHAHTLATDPARFLVAARAGRDGQPHVFAFGSAVDRGPLWFLSMLFVEPGEQARGVGKALLERLLPESLDGRVLATCTDSAQPISNGLYSTIGIVPQMPLLYLVGRPRPDFTWPALPDGVTAAHIDDVGAWRDSAELAAFDRDLLGFTHVADHRFIQDEPRHGFAFRAPDGGLLGYGYAGDIGRLGPIAVADPALMAAVLGHLLTSIVPRGASAVWLPGAVDEAIASAIRSGMRIEGFPVLAGWTEPFTDLARYVPISPGLI